MNSSQSIDRLVILVVIKSQADPLMRRLRQTRFHFTVIDSAGGLIQEPMVCLMLGFGQERLADLLDIVRRCCRPRTRYVPAQMHVPSEVGNLPMFEAQVGGAMVYSMAVEQFIQL
jgi:uncharacterized protein YaaQ